MEKKLAKTEKHLEEEKHRKCLSNNRYRKMTRVANTAKKNTNRLGKKIEKLQVCNRELKDKAINNQLQIKELQKEIDSFQYVTIRDYKKG